MGTRGYHSYRGRGSTGKKVLAIVLGVILVAAGAFLLLQNRYVVYDENGNAHWELPIAIFIVVFLLSEFTGAGSPACPFGTW